MIAQTIHQSSKKSLVLEAALKLFVQRGYFNVCIPEIVRESGVSTGAIYSYFKNKEALGQEIYNQTQDRFNQAFAERLAKIDKTYDKLRAFVELVFEIAEHDPLVMEYMLFVRHTEFLHDSVPICDSKPFRTIRDILRDGMEKQEIKQQDVFVAGICFTGIILRAVDLRLAGIYPNSLLGTLDGFMENAWNAIK